MLAYAHAFCETDFWKEQRQFITCVASELTSLSNREGEGTLYNVVSEHYLCDSSVRSKEVRTVLLHCRCRACLKIRTIL